MEKSIAGTAALPRNYSYTKANDKMYQDARAKPGFVGLQCLPLKASYEGTHKCSFMRRLLPARVLHAPLQRLRQQLAQQCLPHATQPVQVWSAQDSLHVRNSEETNVWGHHAWRVAPDRLRAWATRSTFAYAATQKEEDGFILRNASLKIHPRYPPILLQSDFRSASFGRSSREALLSAIFDLFALSLGRNVITTSDTSTYGQVARCLQESVYWKLADPYAAAGQHVPESSSSDAARHPLRHPSTPPNASTLCEDCKRYPVKRCGKGGGGAHGGDDGTWCFLACCRRTRPNSRWPCLVHQHERQSTSHGGS